MRSHVTVCESLRANIYTSFCFLYSACILFIYCIYRPYLLQECSKVAGPPFVRFGEVDVFQVENQVFTVFGSVGPASVRAERQAGLAELLQDVARRGLGTAVNHSNLGRPQLREGIA